MSDDPAQLRQRAATLRAHARTIADSSAFVLPRRAGDDVWIGPTATRFRDDLGLVLAKLRAASTELTTAADRLEIHADLAEATRGIIRAS
jgi:hypothetical protein